MRLNWYYCTDIVKLDLHDCLLSNVLQSSFFYCLYQTYEDRIVMISYPSITCTEYTLVLDANILNLLGILLGSLFLYWISRAPPFITHMECTLELDVDILNWLGIQLFLLSLSWIFNAPSLCEARLWPFPEHFYFSFK